MSTVPNTVRVREALENAIVDGRYPPGSRLDPEALAREFDCSRTPIREALQQLEASGLVRVAAKRGTFVSEWSVEELAERFEVMAELEAMCARLAARRISDAELRSSRPHTRTVAGSPSRATSTLLQRELQVPRLHLPGDPQRLPGKGSLAAACRAAAVSADAAPGAQPHGTLLRRARGRGRGDPRRRRPRRGRCDAQPRRHPGRPIPRPSGSAEAGATSRVMRILLRNDLQAGARR